MHTLGVPGAVSQIHLTRLEAPPASNTNALPALRRRCPAPARRARGAGGCTAADGGWEGEEGELGEDGGQPGIEGVRWTGTLPLEIGSGSALAPGP